MGDAGTVRSRVSAGAVAAAALLLVSATLASAQTEPLNKSCQVLQQAGVQRIAGPVNLMNFGEGPGLAPGSRQTVCDYFGDPDVNPDATGGMTLTHYRHANE